MSQARRSKEPSTPDPYLELELYLEKVNEEIGKVFDQCFLEVEHGHATRDTCDKYKKPLASPLPAAPPPLSTRLSTGSLDIDDALELRLDYVCTVRTVHTATQTSPTTSHRSSPSWVSDCSSSFACNSSDTVSRSSCCGSEHGDDARPSSSSSSSSSSPSSSSCSRVAGASGGEACDAGMMRTSGQDSAADCVSSDSELLPRTKYSGTFRCLEDDVSAEPRHIDDRPVWVLRHQAVGVQRKLRSLRDRRGVVFDEGPLLGLSTADALDQPPNNLSAHSLPLPQDHAPSSAPKYNCSYMVHIAELANKSSSAPVLKKADNSSEQLSSHVMKVTKQPRSQSDRHLVDTTQGPDNSKSRDYRFFRSFSVKVDNWPIRKAEQIWRKLRDHRLAEIQAAEACKWLRAAGFPQYAQLYEDHQFPMDLSAVRKDHPSLDPDSCQSLFRRLDTLNKCANIKFDSWRSTRMDDSEDENQCALSENWTFQYDQKRWSRTRLNEPLQQLQNVTSTNENSENYKFMSKEDSNFSKISALPKFTTVNGEQLDDVNFSRSGSERLKDGAKAFLRRVESLKSRRRKHQNRERVIISGPHVADMLSMQQKIKHFNCQEILGATVPADGSLEHSSTQSSPLPCSPMASPHRLNVSSPLPLNLDIAKKKFIKRRGSMSCDNRDADEVMSDSECQSSSRRLRNMHSNRLKIRQDSVLSARTDVTSVQSSDCDSDLDDLEITNQPRSSWHSFQTGLLHSDGYENIRQDSCPITRLTCGQLQVLRKLALLKLTTIIEKHCPTHKAGWNWELPKFIRKIKSPDYRDKSVFGVPFNVILQRSGQPLPKHIQEALEWLRLYALDQVGLFRKSGVRSRIQMLKTLMEKNVGPMHYDCQQAYDVADMIKQYFRELPEVLLTTKLSETLILIFQYVPVHLRREAVSCVLLLMPNEHMEVLLSTLDFLQVISEHCSVNQMTVSNLSLCFAPSLFYYSQTSGLTNTKPNSVSPRRWKQTGLPDAKELSENKAAYECLMFLIKHQLDLFMVSKDMLTQCSFTDMDESKPVSLSELGNDQQQDWIGYQEASTKALLKEARERSRGWVCLSDSYNTDVELAYKKVGDGHPLRLWRVATEVEAPPQEVLHRVLRERHIWDPSVLKVRMIEQLGCQSEVFQYACASMRPLVPRDFCVLRTWGIESRRGGCTIVETSVDHPDAEVLVRGSVRAIVLASRYLIEPCGSGRSRVIHLSRVDMMGRTPEWYNKNYGHICRLFLSNMRKSFKHSTTGPESKV